MNSRLPKEPPPGPAEADRQQESGAVATDGASAPTPPTSTLALGAGGVAGAVSSVGAVDAGGDIGDSSSGETPKPLVKQDLFHIEDRVLKHASKTNGGFRPFCGAVRDALAIPDPQAVARVKAVLRKRHSSRGENEITTFVRWSLLLRHVPRLVPPADIIASRFENVIDTFKGVRDGVTGNFGRL